MLTARNSSAKSSQDAPWVLGYSASHNGAVCLLHGANLVCAVQEERLTGVKRQRLRRLDESLAFKYCLDTAGIAVDDLSAIVGCYFSGESTAGSAVVPQGWRGQFHTISHHLGHAVGAFAQSGFEDSAILVVDGQGGRGDYLPQAEQDVAISASVPGSDRQFEIVSIYQGTGTSVRCLEKHLGDWIPKVDQLTADHPMQAFGSLGGMYSAAAHQIFGDANDAGKVMGLAALGKPSIGVDEFFSVVDGRFVFSDKVCQRAWGTERWPANKQALQDLACSVQQALEVGLFKLVDRTVELLPSRQLCFAGGVALNCVANERIINERDFDSVFIMPAAEDSGPAIGAAFYGLWQLGFDHRREEVRHDSMGRIYTSQAIDAAIEAVPCIVRGEGAAPEAVVDRLVDGQILGWFRGGSELGPRALGQRSMLADPRPAGAKDRLNLRVKHREAFRPFAPTILEERVGDWFELPKQATSPTMLRAFRFRPERAGEVPAVVHYDGTGRLQTVARSANPALHALLTAFEAKTGVPILVNTSFNVMGEPIVETPEDALWCLLFTDLDAVVFEHCIVSREQAFESVMNLRPRLRSTETRLQVPLAGSFNLDRMAQGQVDLKATTPWGDRQVPVAQALWPVLELADGSRSGYQMLESLARHPMLSGIDERWLLAILRQLRRAHVITLQR